MDTHLPPRVGPELPAEEIARLHQEIRGLNGQVEGMSRTIISLRGRLQNGPCWKMWGENATWKCVRDANHPGGHQYVCVSRDNRRDENNQVPESVNEGA